MPDGSPFFLPCAESRSEKRVFNLFLNVRKIKAVLIFVSGNPLMSEVQEAVDAIEPYCTAECMNGKFLFGCTEEELEGVARYRMLLAFEQLPRPQADSQKADDEFGEDIPF